MPPFCARTSTKAGRDLRFATRYFSQRGSSEACRDFRWARLGSNSDLSSCRRSYAKIVEEHAAVADLGLIDRTVRMPHERHPDPRPDRERFFRHEAGLWVLAVVEFGDVPAIIVTVFSTERPPA